MKLFNNRFVQAVAALAVVVALALSTPRAAHAVAAALVQVANTTENPAITQDTSKRAGQLVQLVCESFANNFARCVVGSSSNTNPPQYTVAAGQNLVITSVDLNGIAGYAGTNDASLVDTTQGVNYHQWFFSGSNTLQFQYPSGIVLPAGTMPSFFSPNGAVAQITGYLTTN